MQADIPITAVGGWRRVLVMGMMTLVVAFTFAVALSVQVPAAPAGNPIAVIMPLERARVTRIGCNPRNSGLKRPNGPDRSWLPSFGLAISEPVNLRGPAS
jgi:hypothetical protein